MTDITKSGIYYDESGQLILVTQGLGGYTLVAKKKILFRLFFDVSAPGAIPDAIIVTITHVVFGGSTKKNIVIPSGSLLIENSCSNGPSVGILLTGDAFPVPGVYQIDFSFFHSIGIFSISELRFKIAKLVFLMPGRLQLLIHDLVGTAPWGTKIEDDIGWLLDMLDSLHRLAAMLPVRDGVKLGLTQKDAGLCFSFGEDIDPWNCDSGTPHPCTKEEKIAKMLRETHQINSSGTSEHVDATVSWRPRDSTVGEGVGGQAPYDPPPGEGWVSFVGGNLNGKEFTAPIMAQEIGHVFGLEPPASPHFQDPHDGLHSRDRAVIDPFAFDFYHLKPYQPPSGGFIGDVMNNKAGGLSQGRDMVLYNAFDWEHLRNRLAKLHGFSPFMEAKKRPSKKQQDELVDEFHKSFADEPKIKVSNIGKALPAKEGMVWHWTPDGFQLLREDKGKKTRTRLAPSVEGIRSWLEDLGIDEFYAPLGDISLGMVINPNTPTSLQGKEPDVI